MKENVIIFLLVFSSVLAIFGWLALSQAQKILNEVCQMLADFQIPIGVDNVPSGAVSNSVDDHDASVVGVVGSQAS